MLEHETAVEVSDLDVNLPPGGDRTFAVRGINLDIRSNETHCLVGESGSGKSVIAQAIMGMLPPALNLSRGAVRFAGRQLPPQGDKAYNDLRSKHMAMIFQDASASLDPVQRVGRQLEEILEVHGVARSHRRGRVIEILRAVQLPDPEKIFHAYPHQMSGGQAQRVVIAGALLLDPVLLIADEPTTALDVTTQAEILALIRTLQRKRQSSVLFITHDFGVVEDIADRITVMRDGVIVETGPAEDVLTLPQHAYTRELLDAARYNGVKNLSDASQSRVMEARDLDLTYRSGGLFNRREFHAVKGVSLALEAGKTVSVVGESGCGKSSLAKCLLRLEDVDRGTIRFQGKDTTHVSGRDLREYRAKVQVVLQDPYSALDPRQSIRSAIAEGMIIHGASKKAAGQRSEEILELVGLTPQAADRYPHEFSGGQRQRICIARALALEPEVLIADEAVSALDVSVQAQILDLFKSLQERLGFALLFITHDLRIAAAISDEVIVMKDGAIVERGDAEAIFNRPRDAYTQRLVAAAPGGAWARAAS